METLGRLLAVLLMMTFSLRQPTIEPVFAKAPRLTIRLEPGLGLRVKGMEIHQGLKSISRLSQTWRTSE